MNGSDVVLETQVDALLRRIARERESRCLQARQEAEQQVAALLRRARRDARERVRDAAREARRSIAAAVSDRRASLDTAARRAEQGALRRLLDTAWTQLPAALEARWSDPVSRRAWSRASALIARDLLRADAGWRVELDADAPEPLCDDVLGTVCEIVAPTAALERLPALGAGLRLRRGLACLDATVAGLLSSRERIEAELLAEFDRGGRPADGGVVA